MARIVKVRESKPSLGLTRIAIGRSGKAYNVRGDHAERYLIGNVNAHGVGVQEGVLLLCDIQNFETFIES